jgi:D-serine deaminase-like pyridoxal phosphate-dependent protein
MSFPGHAYAANGDEELRRIATSEQAALQATADALTARGIEPGTLSAGATPLTAAAPAWPAEYRFGNYVFNDATQVALGSAELDDCAVTVAATVVGRPAQDRVILDAGSKALAAERMSAATETFGLVRGHPEVAVRRLYEEHAICEVGSGTALRLGDRVEVVPNHACTCANLHAEYTVLRRDGRLDAWPLAARGWS